MPRTPDATLRERLIRAATTEFAAAGFAGATLDSIAARAGVTKGGVYFHFAGKEELFFAVLDHWRDQRRRTLAVPAAGGGCAVLALQSFLTSYLAFHFREPEATHLLRVLATELRGKFTSRLREDERQEHRWLRASVRELLVLGMGDGSLHAEDPALGAFLVAAGVFGVLDQWHAGQPDVQAHGSAADLARGLLSPFTTGARAAAPPTEYPEILDV